LDNEDLYDLYISPIIIRVMNARRMRWEGPVAQMREMRNTKFWSENVKERDHSEDLSIDGKTILERI